MAGGTDNNTSDEVGTNGPGGESNPSSADGQTDLIIETRASFFDNAKYSDVTLTCGDRQWAAHKYVIFQHSDVLAKAFEGTFKEAHTGTIELHDDDPAIIHEILRYIYTGEIEHDPESPLTFLVRLYTTADKYNMSTVVRSAEESFMSLVREENAFKTVDFADAIEEVYATFPDRERKIPAILMVTVVDHAHVLYTDESTLAFREMANRLAPFASELASRLATAAKEEVRGYKSKCCSGLFFTTSDLAPKFCAGCGNSSASHRIEPVTRYWCAGCKHDFGATLHYDGSSHACPRCSSSWHLQVLE